MTNNDREAKRMEEDIKTNHVGGLIQLDRYSTSDINLRDWEITSVIDDVLLVEYADGDANTKMAGGILIRKEVVFLNEARIFGVVKPKE